MEVLRGLLEAGVDVPLVLSQPDRPAGRKRVLTPPPVATFAREHNLPLLQPERASEALSALQALEPAAVAICAYGQLLPDELLALCPWLNLHPSLLPRWRGAAPIERMLMAGDTQTGVAIMQTVAELEAGPIISLDPIVVESDADTETIEREALRLGVPALVRAIEAAAAGSLDAAAQATEAVTYAAKLERADRLIDPALHTVVDTLNRIRALRPQIGALLMLDGETFTIWRATAATVEMAPGACAVVGDELQVGCVDGAIAISELQTAGKRALATAEWLRGRRDLPTSASCPV